MTLTSLHASALESFNLHIYKMPRFISRLKVLHT